MSSTYAAATIARAQSLAYAVTRTDFDAQGRPVAVHVGTRRYRTRRTAEAVAGLIHLALFRSVLSGGRQLPVSP